jgi:regulatory protein
LTHYAPDPQRPGYRVLEVDRGRFASLPDEPLELLPLEVGAEIPRLALERLEELADEEAALRAALKALARRPHAQADLRRRLVRRQHKARAVDAALPRLVARGLLDDRAFAEHWAATRAARGRGPARLVYDLVAQGVARAVAEAGVAAGLAREAIDPVALALRAARRRIAALSAHAPHERRRRLTAWLVRRGFDRTTVQAVVDQLA